MSPEHQTIVDRWNAMAIVNGLAQVRLLPAARAARLRTRIADAGVDRVLEAITRVSQSDFCRGKSAGGWKADFDFLIQASSFTRILEGRYDNRQKSRPTYRNGAIEYLARMAEQETSYPTIDNLTMIAGDD
jgi:hypothetical protein